MSIFENLQKISSLLGGERAKSPQSSSIYPPDQKNISMKRRILCTCIGININILRVIILKNILTATRIAKLLHRISPICKLVILLSTVTIASGCSTKKYGVVEAAQEPSSDRSQQQPSSNNVSNSITEKKKGGGVENSSVSLEQLTGLWSGSAGCLSEDRYGVPVVLSVGQSEVNNGEYIAFFTTPYATVEYRLEERTRGAYREVRFSPIAPLDYDGPRLYYTSKSFDLDEGLRFVSLSSSYREKPRCRSVRLIRHGDYNQVPMRSIGESVFHSNCQSFVNVMIPNADEELRVAQKLKFENPTLLRNYDPVEALKNLIISEHNFDQFITKDLKTNVEVFFGYLSQCFTLGTQEVRKSLTAAVFPNDFYASKLIRDEMGQTRSSRLKTSVRWNPAKVWDIGSGLGTSLLSSLASVTKSRSNTSQALDRAQNVKGRQLINPILMDSRLSYESIRPTELNQRLASIKKVNLN